MDDSTADPSARHASRQRHIRGRTGHAAQRRAVRSSLGIRGPKSTARTPRPRPTPAAATPLAHAPHPLATTRARTTPTQPAPPPATPSWARQQPGALPTDGVQLLRSRSASDADSGGCSLMVEHELPKLRARVRFSSPAPTTEAQVRGMIPDLGLSLVDLCFSRRARCVPDQAGTSAPAAPSSPSSPLFSRAARDSSSRVSAITRSRSLVACW